MSSCAMSIISFHSLLKGPNFMSSGALRGILLSTLRQLLKPSTFIAIMGPVILSVNRSHLLAAAAHNESVLTTGPLFQINKILGSAEAYALVEYNIQVFALVLAWVFLQFEGCSWLRVVAPSSNGVGENESSKAGFLSLDGLSTAQIALVFALLVQLVGVLFYVLLSGALASLETVALYIPAGDIPRSLHAPPVNSPISWSRVGVVIMSIWIAVRVKRDCRR
jgi:hypothetical protein